jgi:proton glutamate symport protein
MIPRWLRSSVAQSLVAVLSGLAVGLFIHYSGSAALKGVVDPIFTVGTLWLNSLRMIIIPMLVSLLVSGLVAHGDARTTSRVGGGAFVLFWVALAFGVAFSWLATPPLARMLWPAGSEAPIFTAENSAEGIRAAGNLANRKGAAADADWVRGLVPSNLFRAASEENLVSLVVFAVLFGLALKSTPGEPAQAVARFVQGVADVLKVLLGWIHKVMPIGMFALTLTYTATLGVSVTRFIGGFAALVCILLFAYALVWYPLTAVFSRFSIPAFARAVFPVQVTAVGTRSSIACLPDLLKAAERGLGLEMAVSRITLPLAVSLFKANHPVSSPAKLLFCAHVFGLDISPATYIVFSATIIVLSFGGLGIAMSSSGMRSLPPLVAAGVPIEAVVMLQAVEVVSDIFKAVVNVTADLSVAAIVERFVPVPKPKAAAAHGD